MSERVEARNESRIEIADDFARGGKNWAGNAGIPNDKAELADRLRALPVVDVDNRTRRSFKAAFANVAHDAHYHKQARIAIHVAEFDGLAQRIMVRPLLLCQRIADDGDRLRIGRVAIFKESSLQHGNTQCLEISL